MDATLNTKAAEKERQELSEATVKRISAVWPDTGSLDDLKRVFPAIDANLEAAKDRLDAVWQAARCELATPEEFQTALDAWEAANYKAAAALKAVK